MDVIGNANTKLMGKPVFESLSAHNRAIFGAHNYEEESTKL